MYTPTGYIITGLTTGKVGAVLLVILDFILMGILKYGVANAITIFLEMYLRLGKQKLTLSALEIHVVPVQMT